MLSECSRVYQAESVGRASPYTRVEVERDEKGIAGNAKQGGNQSALKGCNPH